MIDLDALAVAGALVALGMSAVAGWRASGRARALAAAGGAAAAVAVVTSEAAVAGAAVLVAALSARRACPEADAGRAAWAFLGDALVAAGIGAAALDSGTAGLAWTGSSGPAPEWAVAVVALGAVVRLTTVGLADLPLVAVGVVFGVRLVGATGAPEWLVVGTAAAFALAWAGRPVTATLALGWAAAGAGAAPAALLLAGAGLAAAAAAVEAAEARPVDWREVGAGLRSRAAPARAGGWSSVPAVLALVPAGVALVRVASDEAPEAAPVLVALLVVLVLASRMPEAGDRVDVGAGIRATACAGATVALLTPLLAPGWWMDRLGIPDAGRAASDALTAARAGSVAAVAVGVTAGLLAWAASRVVGQARAVGS